MSPLPCPFCGRAPTVLPENPTVEGGAWAQVRCFNTACPAKPWVRDGEDTADDRGSDAYKASAIKRWNTRAPVKLKPCGECGIDMGTTDDEQRCEQHS